MKRWAVPGVPFAVSLCLSFWTAGSHPGWQDSGLYLTAVKELGVLYPPGFVMYELLCWIWTQIFPFIDFTLAVHLFSSACAALATGVMAVAVRDLLRSRGRIFQVSDADPGDLADWCGMVAGVLLASGFTFWSTAILAKGYALYYLLLALLLWRMIRADESGKSRDFLLVAALVGAAWQGHPSAALAGAALLAYVAIHAKTLGWKTIAGGIAVASVCALGPSLILLPLLSSRDPWFVMGMPKGFGETLLYLTGRRFLSVPGVFGLDRSRVASFGIYFWQEYLGVGCLLLAIGLTELFRRRRRLAGGLLAWLLPYVAGTILFKIEGQHDCWFVAAWLPLYLAVGVGAWKVGRLSGEHARPILLAAGLAGTAWAALANHGDVSQRDYELAEAYGRTLLDTADPNAVLLLHGDDSMSLAAYLQRVRGERGDVVLVTANFLGSDAALNWYDEQLLQRHPFLKPPNYSGLYHRFPSYKPRDVATAAFLNANAECGRPIFIELLLPLELIRRDYTLVPAGAVWKLVPAGATAPEERYWRFPVEPEKILPRVRRARGQQFKPGAVDFQVEPQAYEWRLINLLVLSRFHLAMARTEQGRYALAAKLCESILALDRVYWDSAEIVHIYGISLHAAGEDAKAEPALRRSVEISSAIPRNQATANVYLGEIARKRGDEAEAQRRFRAALDVPGLDDATRRKIEERLAPK